MVVLLRVVARYLARSLYVHNLSTCGGDDCFVSTVEEAVILFPPSSVSDAEFIIDDDDDGIDNDDDAATD